MVLFATYLGILGVAGQHLPAGQDAIEPMAFFFFLPKYFVALNCFYTLTWATELAAWGFHAEVSERARAWAFWSAIAVASVITSVPFWWVCVVWQGKPVIS